MDTLCELMNFNDYYSSSSEPDIRSGIEENHTEKEDLLQNIFDLMQQFRNINKQECDNKKDPSVKGQLDRDLWATSNHDHDYYGSSERGENAVLEEVVENYDLVEEKQKTTVPLNENLTILSNINNTVTPTTKVTSKREILVPSSSRAKRYPLKKGALDYLNNKQEKQLEIRKQELQLEERKIALEERRLSLEEQKFAAESAERNLKWQLERERHEVKLAERRQLQQNLEFQQRLIEKFLDTK